MDLHLQLGQAIAGCESDPSAWGRAMLDLLRNDQAGFLVEADEVLARFEATQGHTYLLAVLCRDGQILPRLVNLAKTNRARLPEVTQTVQKIHPQFHLELAEKVNNTDDESILLRCLDIIRSADPSVELLRQLQVMVTSAHPKVRSRATFLLGRMVRSLNWFQDRIRDEDPRVRANAIEALWGNSEVDAEGMFRQATKDPHGRTAANAWVGLYLLGQQDSVEGLIALAQEPDTNRQASAAWGMGRTGDARFLPTITAMVQSINPLVRNNALRAMTRIRQAASIHREIKTQ